MNNNISVSFIDTKQAVDNKPPTQSVGVSGACHFVAGSDDKRYFAICTNPRFQLFVAEYLAEKNISPYSLKVEENAFLFLQDNDPNLLWVAFCDWFADKQKQGRWINDSTPDKSTPFVFGQNVKRQVQIQSPQPQIQIEPQANVSNVPENQIDKIAVMNKLFALIDENIALSREIVRLLQ